VKRASALAGAGLSLALVLSACGGGTSTPVVTPPTTTPPTTTPPNTTPTPDLSKVYNPAASLSQTSGGRVAYKGDWVMVVKLSDNSYRYGVNSVNVDASSATFINAGGGVSGWCRTATCASNEELGTLIAGSLNANGKAQLTVGMVPRNAATPPTPRFIMADEDGIVDNINGSPVIAGSGFWTENGQDFDAFFSFIQTSDVPSVKASSLSPSSTAAVRTGMQVISSLKGGNFNKATATSAIGTLNLR